MPLAEGGGAVPIVLKHLGDRCGVVVPLSIVARVARRDLGQIAEANLVMVAAGKQRGSGRGTDRISVKGVVAHAGSGKFV